MSVQPAGSMESTSEVVSGAVVDPRTGRDHVVRVDVEDELRAGQRLLAGGRVLRRRHLEPASLAPGGSRLRVRGRRRGAAGELEDGERRRDGPGALQEAAAVDARPGAPRSSMDSRISALTAAVLRPRRRRDELAVGDRPGVEGELVVGTVAQATGEGADASHAGRIRPARPVLKGRSQAVEGGCPRA